MTGYALTEPIVLARRRARDEIYRIRNERKQNGHTRVRTRGCSEIAISSAEPSHQSTTNDKCFGLESKDENQIVICREQNLCTFTIN